MRAQTSLLTSGLLFMLLSPGCGSLTTGSIQAQRTVQFSAEHVADSGLFVETSNGTIGVTAAPEASQVGVLVVLRCGGDTQEEAQRRVAQATVTLTRLSDSTLQVAAHLPEPCMPNDGASIWVEIPSARGAELRTSNGSVTSSGLCGTLRIDTSNGSVRVSGHDGPVHIDTSNGGVVATEVGGPVTLDTSNGSVAIDLSDEACGPLMVDTSNGRITVSVGSAFSGNVRLDTSNGSVKVHDPAGRIRSRNLSRSGGALVIGGDGPASVLDTSNGGIAITVR